MRTLSSNKYGRTAIGAFAVIFGIMLCSCGSGMNASSVNASEEAIVSSDSSGERAGHSTSDPMERLAGKYFIDGDSTAASIEVLSDGSFIAYYASGTVEQKGYVSYEAEKNDQKMNVFVFYTDEGKPYMGFVDSGEEKISEFETGNGNFRYVRLG